MKGLSPILITDATEIDLSVCLKYDQMRNNGILHTYFPPPYKGYMDIRLCRTKVRYGWRIWFIAPCCQRRTSKLYIYGGRVGCRKCHDLKYASQYRKDASSRSRMTDRKLQRIQNRRLWHGESLTRFGEQYQKLQAESEAQTEEMLNDMRIRHMELDAQLATDLEIHYGVQLIFCDPSQQSLNGADPKTFLKRVEKLVEGELENEEKASLAIERMRSRVLLGYYPFNNHAGYKKTEAEDGLHVPDEPKFSLLRDGCRLIIYKNHTPEQAVRWMNENGYRTNGGKKLDVNHFIEFIVDTYYCGIIEINKPGWPKNVRGIHIPLLSKREHDILIAILRKRNPRTRYNHNPKFMLGNMLRHKECEGLGGYEKFSGHFHNRGRRPNGRQRTKKPVYDCRDCRKRLGRELVHSNFTNFLNDLEFIPDQKRFKDALIKVWKDQRGSTVNRLNTLIAKRSIIDKKIKDTAASYATEKDEVIKSTIGKLLKDYDNELKEVDLEMHQAKDTELESEDFVSFAFDFVEKLREKWWKLSWENMQRGEQIIFNGKIYMDNAAIVHTPSLSTIYRLGTNKKDLGEVNFNQMVELRGIAPRSAGVSG